MEVVAVQDAELGAVQGAKQDAEQGATEKIEARPLELGAAEGATEKMKARPVELDAGQGAEQGASPMSPSGGAMTLVAHAITWSPANSACSSFSAKHMWFDMWPGVNSASSVQSGPPTASPWARRSPAVSACTLSSLICRFHTEFC